MEKLLLTKAHAAGHAETHDDEQSDHEVKKATTKTTKACGAKVKAVKAIGKNDNGVKKELIISRRPGDFRTEQEANAGWKNAQPK
jgi:hypothetical protein